MRYGIHIFISHIHSHHSYTHYTHHINLIGSLRDVSNEYRELRSDILTHEPMYASLVGHGDSAEMIVPSDEAKDFMQRLLRKNPQERMSNFDEIKRHPWFEGFDWNALQAKTMPAPVMPNIKYIV